MAIELDMTGLINLAKLFYRIIDFRSRFTATHSIGVAMTAKALSKLIGFSERECQMMEIAGYLHDLGKLEIPAEILEKPAKLTEDEFNIIKSHTYYTYSILKTISDLDLINDWPSFHHERLDGKGYPFHHKSRDLSIGSRIMAVADVFTAISEERPYRKGMSSDKALQVLQQMAQDSALDAHVVSTLAIHFNQANSIRITVQASASKEYHEFRKQ
ncbi:MAG: HD domain-containing protein [Candidatus Omnitrophica bacterium]|nr:HD domain-containing protein [Candidatus Omnitrophota bacterium]